MTVIEKWRKRAFIVMLAGAFGATAVQAHHSFAVFDFTKVTTLTGTVKVFQWTNPHTFIKLMAPDASGQIIEWTLESGTPNINARHGWKKSDIKSGDKVTAEMHPMRDGSPAGTLMHVKLPDGRILYGTGNDFIAAPDPASAPKDAPKNE